MSFQIYYILNKKIILQHGIDTYSKEDAKNSTQEVIEFLENHHESVYLLFDLSRTSRISVHASEARNITEKMFKNPKVVTMLVYGSRDSILANFITNFLATLFRLPMKTFKTEAMALAHLVKLDPSLEGILEAEIQKINFGWQAKLGRNV